MSQLKTLRVSPRSLLNYPSKSHQQGVALLTILLLVTAIVIVAGSMLARQQIMIREYEVTKRQGEFREAALAGEAFARELIAQDSQVNQTDSPQDVWAKPIPDYPVENGKVSLTIVDDASRFNINNLYHDGNVDDKAFNFFKALLQSQGLDPKLAHAVVDWQDPDSDTTPDGGAEADYYQSLGQSQTVQSTQIANQPFIRVEDLQFIRGMDKEKLAKISPFVTAVPYYLPINVNTAQPQLLALIPAVSATHANNDPKAERTPAKLEKDASVMQLDLAEVTNWAQGRVNNMPLESVEKLWTVPVFSSVSSEQRSRVAGLFDVQSRAFRVQASVAKEDKTSYFTCQIAKVDKNAALTVNTATSPTDVAAMPQVITYNRQFSSLPLQPTVRSNSP